MLMKSKGFFKMWTCRCTWKVANLSVNCKAVYFVLSRQPATGCALKRYHYSIDTPDKNLSQQSRINCTSPFRLWVDKADFQGEFCLPYVEFAEWHLTNRMACDFMGEVKSIIKTLTTSGLANKHENLVWVCVLCTVSDTQPGYTLRDGSVKCDKIKT